MASATGFLIEIDGAPLADGAAGLLVSGYVDTSLRLPDLFALRFRDADRTLLTTAGIRIGAKLKVSVATDKAPAPQPLLAGEVTAVEREFDRTGTFTTVRGYDIAHRLFRGRQSHSYTQVTASDAATTVARRAGLPVGTVESTGVVFDHLAQAAETDWEFLERLARRVGFDVAVRDGKLDFARPRVAADAPDGDSSTAHPLVLRFGTDLLQARAVLTAADQVGTIEVRGWDVAQKRAIVAEAKADTTVVALPTTSPADLARTFGDRTYVATDRIYGTQAEADTAATAVGERIGSSFAELEAVVRGNPDLRAGVAVRLDGFGEPFDGKYTVSAARHRYLPAGGGYTTALSVTGRQERSLRGLAAGAPGPDGSPGVVIGQVSDTNDPAGMARVKLTFPWLAGDYVSDWARTVQPGAGAKRGAQVLPEVGDEVLVAFEQGDLGRPYVLGGLYNGIDQPDTADPAVVDGGSGTVARRSLVSRRGHRIDLLDADGRTEGVRLATGDGALIVRLDQVGTAIEVRSDGTVRVSGARGIVLDAGSAKLELKGGEIALTAQGKVSIAASGTAELKATGPTVIGGMPVKIN